MCHIYQIKILNLRPDQFTSFYEVITYMYRPIYKEVLPPDIREQHFLTL